MEIHYLDFEEKIKKIDKHITELKKLEELKSSDYSKRIRKLEKEKVKQLREIYSNLSAWQIIQVARHQDRPIFQDYLKGMINDFKEMHGDKYFEDDKSMITGLGKIGLEKLMIIGQNKGKKLEEKKQCRFGYGIPEGFRKALDKMKFAEKFNIPIVTFIDTKGAYPGIESEERGIARAIAMNLREMPGLQVPIINIVIGEGGSGGALAIGVGDKFAMLENSYYSVITPEGCAAILWRDKAHAPEAAEALKLTSKYLLELKLIDEIIPEPLGGAHRNYQETFNNVQKYILKTLKELKQIPLSDLLEQRYKKLRNF